MYLHSEFDEFVVYGQVTVLPDVLDQFVMINKLMTNLQRSVVFIDRIFVIVQWTYIAF